jgi:hypothetical protein
MLSGDVEATGVVRATGDVDEGDWVASLELVGQGWIGRLRYGAPAPELVGGFGLSQPTFVNAIDSSAPLIKRILPTTKFISPREVGVYFEVYGVDSGESLKFRVTIEDSGRSFLNRVAAVFRTGAGARGIVEWAEPAGSDLGVGMSRQLNVGLSELSAGQYNLRLTVERDGGVKVDSARGFVITR